MENFWIIFSGALAGSVLAGSALVFLSQGLISHWLSKDLAEHQNKIHEESEQSLEKIRGAIAAANIEHQIVIAKLHEKRADAIYLLHRRIVECVEKAGPVVYNADGSDKEIKERIVSEFQDSFRTLVLTLRESQLYLSKETCQFLDSSLKEIVNPITSYMFWMNIRKGTEKEHDKYNEKWEQAVTVIEERAPEIIGRLEAEFRALLGVR